MLNQQSCVWKVVNQCSQADKSVLHTSLKQIAKESVENIKKRTITLIFWQIKHCYQALKLMKFQAFSVCIIESINVEHNFK